ncbi:MAG: hypothetical protein R3F43_02515 [bacterium]
MTIRIKWLEAWSYRPLIAHIEEGLQEFLPEGPACRRRARSTPC